MSRHSSAAEKAAMTTSSSGTTTRATPRAVVWMCGCRSSRSVAPKSRSSTGSTGTRGSAPQRENGGEPTARPRLEREEPLQDERDQERRDGGERDEARDRERLWTEEREVQAPRLQKVGADEEPDDSRPDKSPPALRQRTPRDEVGRPGRAPQPGRDRDQEQRRGRELPDLEAVVGRDPEHGVAGGQAEPEHREPATDPADDCADDGSGTRFAHE